MTPDRHPDPDKLRLIRERDQERQARIKAEQRANGLAETCRRLRLALAAERLVKRQAAQPSAPDGAG